MSYKFKESDFIVELPFESLKLRLNLINLVYSVAVIRLAENKDTLVIAGNSGDSATNKTIDAIIANRSLISYLEGVDVPSLDELAKASSTSAPTLLSRFQTELFLDTEHFPLSRDWFQAIDAYDNRKRVKSLAQYFQYMDDMYEAGYLDNAVSCLSHLGRWLLDLWLSRSDMWKTATIREKSDYDDELTYENLVKALEADNLTKFPPMLYLSPFATPILAVEAREEKSLKALVEKAKKNGFTRENPISANESLLMQYYILMLALKTDVLKKKVIDRDLETTVTRFQDGLEMPNLDVLDVTMRELQDIGIVITSEGVVCPPVKHKMVASAQQYDNLSSYYQILRYTTLLLFLLHFDYLQKGSFHYGECGTFYDYAYNQEKYRSSALEVRAQNGRLRGIIEEQSDKIAQLEKEIAESAPQEIIEVDYNDEKLFEEMADKLEEAELENIRLKRKIAQLLGDDVVDDDAIEYLDLIDTEQVGKKIEVIKQHSILLFTGVKLARITEELGVEQRIVEKTNNVQTLLGRNTQTEYIGVYTRRVGHKVNNYIKSVTKARQSTFFMISNTNFEFVVDSLYNLITKRK